ncbi:hypothetical protein [Actinoallomurus sp. NPDC050550]|uniref:hypothetical protein n=1 Tax=Actinoallomurus sp. NPDC050550 TaxID=3154937 RepID=UPI0033E1E71D
MLADPAARRNPIPGEAARRTPRADPTCPGTVSLSDSDPSVDSHLSKAQLLQSFGRYAGTS